MKVNAGTALKDKEEMLVSSIFYQDSGRSKNENLIM